MNEYTFGNYLYQLRVKKGLSQFQLGHLLGVSDKTISKWENSASKPKLEILIKLSQIFNISVDELLSINNSNDFKDNFYSNKTLLANLFEYIPQKYGDNPPYVIYNRFLSEYYAFITTNPEAVIYLKLLKSIKEKLEAEGQFFKIEGFTNSLFIPYIMGLTRVNPLPPHYYCPNCKKVEFHNELYTGWDLPEKVCDCGHQLISDGHNIPFETASQSNLNCNSNHYKILISKNNLNEVIKMICDSSDRTMSVINDEHSGYPVIIVNSVCQDNENSKSIIKKTFTTMISLRTSKVADNIALIQSRTGIKIDNIRFDNQCLQYIFNNPINQYIKELIQKFNPDSFSDFIKMEAITRNSDLIENNSNELDKTKLITYREDIFNYILKQSNEKNTGFALEIMYHVSRGRYTNGIPEHILRNLNEINAEQWFIDAIQKIKFLNTKCYGVSEAQYELAFSWYKINFPEITEAIFNR